MNTELFTDKDAGAERELVCTISRTVLSEDAAGRIGELVARPLDWDYVIGIASRNGVLPLVARNLLQGFDAALPPEPREALSQFFREHTRHNIFLSGKLVGIIRLLEQSGIPALPFKGPLLALRGYQNLALRQFVDLDILVQPRHFDDAVRLMTANGYLPFGKVHWLRRKTLILNRRKDVGLISEDGQVRVELHWKLSGSHFSLPFELNELWERLETTEFGGVAMRTLPFPDLFVYLCLHGSRHGWERLTWIIDLCELIRSERNVDWEALRSHARRHGCEKVVELGLFLAEGFFGVRAGYPDLDKVLRDHTFAKAADRIREKIFTGKQTSTDIGDWYLYHLMLKERPSDKLKIHLHYLLWYLKLALKPNEMDETVFHLPVIFYPLYFILRPSRLLYNLLSADSKK